MKKDMMIAGVGGQGILSIAAVIDMAAIKSGLFIKQSEVHGMSQRGGAVQSHLRISDQIIYSDIISLGSAHLIIAVEPLEALRYISYLDKNGRIVTSVNFFKNIDNYPNEIDVLEELKKLKCIMVDAEAIARDCGNIKASNMVVLGAALPFIEISQQKFEESIEELFNSKGSSIVEANIKAFRRGIELANK